MAQLSAHFADTELGVAGCTVGLQQNARFLCEQVLEPLRAHFGAAVHIHDAYRDPDHNSRVGGKAASYHLFHGGQAAADIDVSHEDLRAVFDWIRLDSGLPFDKVILETNSSGIPACVHIQIDRLNRPRRQAFIGHTGAATQYLPAEVR